MVAGEEAVQEEGRGRDELGIGNYSYDLFRHLLRKCHLPLNGEGYTAAFRYNDCTQTRLFHFPFPISHYPFPILSNMLISPRFLTTACNGSLRTVHAAMGVWNTKRWKWGEKKRAALAL